MNNISVIFTKYAYTLLCQPCFIKLDKGSEVALSLKRITEDFKKIF